jgi:tripartite ATP-independent transporter DctM subunit
VTAILAPVVGALALFGLPLFCVFAAFTLIYFQILDRKLELIVTNVYERFAGAPTLVTIPLFTFAGYLMAESKTGERLVRLFNAWFGWMPGGLAIVCLLACAFFTTFTGASGVTIIAIGGLLYPVLLKQAYPEKFSLGLITASGSLGLLFPPSLPIIIYGIISGADIQRLFVAGILPGIVLLVVLGLYCVWVAVRGRVERQPFRWGEAWASLRGSFWEAILPVVIFGLMYSGAISVNETAVVAAAYVLVVECFVYRDVHLIRDLPRIVRDAMVLVGAIFIILAVAVSFTDCLIDDEIPEKLVNFVNQFVSNKWVFLLLLNILLLIVGCLMDIFSAIIVVVPLIVPVAKQFGVDPTHLGIVFLANLEIGYLTPPVGINLFLSSMRFNKPVVELYRVAVPYLLLMLVALGIITYVPQLSLVLPNAFGMRSRAEQAEAEVQRGARETPGADKDDIEEEERPAAKPGADADVPAKEEEDEKDTEDTGELGDEDERPKASPDAGVKAGAGPPAGAPKPEKEDEGELE